ncbi:MAG TPA: acyltransferase [Mycobacteriales bacterium]|nr:acyltransferase [Mycobacteriales bacterium]
MTAQVAHRPGAAPPPPQSSQPQAQAAVTGHLWQVDVVRILTFGCVIGVHATSHANPGTSTAAGATLMLLHFTREVFFLLTGFVLFHAHGRRPLHLGQFWRRRCTLVGVPYVVWTVVYFFAHIPGSPTGGWWLQRLGFELLTGTACYHLYFLLVSLQAYLLFPVLRAVVRRTEGHHGWLLGAALAIQLAQTWALQAAGPVGGGWGVLARHADALLPTYIAYLVAGALAAWHLPRWQRWVEHHPVWVAAAVAGGAATALGAYAAQLHGPASAGHAQAVLQPAMLPWSLAVGAGLYALGSAWAARGPRVRLRRLVQVGSHISFGVYLVHPLALQWFAEHGLGLPDRRLPALPATVLLVLASIVVASAAVLAVQRTALSLPLTGRERRPAPG